MANTNPPCAEPNCDKVNAIRIRGYCPTCYARHRRTGTLPPKAPAKPALNLVGVRPADYARQIGVSRARVDQMLFPEKHRARLKLAYAIKTGDVVRPTSCEECGVTCKPHAHHHDYSKPFDVQWFCTGCHGKSHQGQPRKQYVAPIKSIEWPEVRFDGTVLKRWRETSGFTQSEAARRLGISFQLLWNIENDKHPPSARTLFRFCILFNCEIADLFIDASAANQVAA